MSFSREELLFYFQFRNQRKTFQALGLLMYDKKMRKKSKMTKSVFENKFSNLKKREKKRKRERKGNVESFIELLL